MFDDLQEIFIHLRTNKLRTALTGLSVSVGIFLLIVLLGSGNGLIHALQSNTGNMAMDVMMVWPGTTSKPYQGLERGRRIKFDNRDLDVTGRAFGSRVTRAAGQISQNGVTMTAGDKTLSASLEGNYPDNRDIQRLNIVQGRYLNEQDLRERRKSIVISEKGATEFFGSAAAAVGKPLRIDGSVYTVVGVYSDQGRFGGMEGHVPFTTLQTLYNKGQDVDQLTLRTQGVDEEETDSIFKHDMRSTMAIIHTFDPDDGEAIWMMNTSRGAAETNRAMNYLRNALWIVGLLTLLSGVVGISNIMLITVKERTHEFGIRKAIGARPWAILRSVLLESVLITALFGYIGLVCGVLATEYMSMQAGQQTLSLGDMTFYTFLDPTVDLSIALQALGVLIVAGLLAGFFPARKAVRVKPIEALRAN